MTNRELLEAAAKAAGLTPDVGVKIKSGHLMVTDEDAEQPFFWNPLTDDGDALRLAVKLGFLIAHSAYKPGETAYGFVRIEWYGQAWYGPSAKFEPEKFTDDPYTATRRAIVRAAAEIGKEKK